MMVVVLCFHRQLVFDFIVKLSQARNQRPTLFPISIARSIVRPLEAAVNYIIRQIPMLMRETLNVASELAVSVERCRLI